MNCLVIAAILSKSSPQLHSYVDSVFGWDPISKKHELFDPLSRFILVHQQSRYLSNGHPSKRLVAYTMFRFDLEEGEEVVYWWVNWGTNP
jgi:hypothetical protein